MSTLTPPAPGAECRGTAPAGLARPGPHADRPADAGDRVRGRVARHGAGALRALGPAGGAARALRRLPRRHHGCPTWSRPAAALRPGRQGLLCAAPGCFPSSGSRCSCCGRAPTSWCSTGSTTSTPGSTTRRPGRAGCRVEEFDRDYSRFCLVAAARPGLRAGRRAARRGCAGVVRRLRPVLSEVLAVVAMGLLATIPGLAVAAVAKFFVDDVLVQDLTERTWPLVGALAALVAAPGLLTVLQQRVLIRLGTRLTVAESARFVRPRAPAARALLRRPLGRRPRPAGAAQPRGRRPADGQAGQRRRGARGDGRLRRRAAARSTRARADRHRPSTVADPARPARGMRPPAASCPGCWCRSRRAQPDDGLRRRDDGDHQGRRARGRLLRALGGRPPYASPRPGSGWRWPPRSATPCRSLLRSLVAAGVLCIGGAPRHRRLARHRLAGRLPVAAGLVQRARRRAGRLLLAAAAPAATSSGGSTTCSTSRSTRPATPRSSASSSPAARPGSRAPWSCAT